MAKKRLTKKEQDDLDYREIRNHRSRFVRMANYVGLIGGLLIVLIGICQILTGSTALGQTLRNRYGAGGGQGIALDGTSTVTLGLIICIYPIYRLGMDWFIKQSISQRKNPDI